MNLNKKTFYASLMAIAVPVSLQNLISAALNMIDTAMIGKVGVEPLAAVGIANQLFFLFMLICFGICSGASIFIAQYWGKKDVSRIKAVMGFVILLELICGGLFTFIAMVFPGQIMDLFKAAPGVRALGISYLRIVGLSYLATSITFAISFSSRSIQQATLPMVASAIGLVVNAGFNYLLIFGKFGFPVLGVQGAAIATVIARITELTIIVVIIYRSHSPLAGTFKEYTSIPEGFVKQYVRTCLPVIINEFAWSLGMVMYSVAYSRLGSEAIAAVQVSNTVSNLFTVFCFGVANACGVMIGNALGAGDNELAIEYSRRFLYLTFIVGAVIGGVIYLLSGYIIQLFGIPTELKDSVGKLLLIKALFLPMITFNAALIIGILRSGGDTRYAMLLEMGGVWLIGVPMAFIGAVWLKLPIHIIVLMTSMEEIFKSIIGVPRVISKKWVRNLV